MEQTTGFADAAELLQRDDELTAFESSGRAGLPEALRE